ncbi:MAG: M14 family metallopeptidase [Rhodobacteraceae bacterium]|nr:M14 family metallopeptidase [Paracoccaceae bacterium]
MIDESSPFSPSYRTARQRFLAAVDRAGLERRSCLVPGKGPAGEELAIDVGLRLVPGARRAVVVSSGLHGVEGVFGAAAQVALLADAPWLKAPNVSLAVVHALNPHGFAWERRCNENNVDLNRSFFENGAARPDTPTLYRRLTSFLNPTTPPSRIEPFAPKVASVVARYGFGNLKATLPVGQYDFPKGLFYGGAGPSATQRILSEHLPEWIGDSRNVLHIDLHSGLGPWGSYKLLLEERPKDLELAALQRRFGAGVFDYDRDPRAGRTTSYEAVGLMSSWLPRRFPERSYRVITAEFGAYRNIRVLQSLRAENRAHHFGAPQAEHAWAKADLLEMFAPADAGWRRRAVADAVNIVRRAMS